jgi:hypothetical protein
MIEEVAEYWLWSTITALAEDSSKWLEETLRVHQNTTAIFSFLKIVSCYWQQIHRLLAGKLIITSARIARRDALPLLKSVEKTATDASLRDTAQSYRQFILEHPQVASSPVITALPNGQ